MPLERDCPSGPDPKEAHANREARALPRGSAGAAVPRGGDRGGRRDRVIASRKRATPTAGGFRGRGGGVDWHESGLRPPPGEAGRISSPSASRSTSWSATRG